VRIRHRIYSVIAFLASDDVRWIAGDLINIDDGLKL
jgi:hypothetical protein